MSTNENLHRANASKNDEFYTRYEDVVRTLTPFKDYITGKHIYCNCDNPDVSNYVKYFLDNFKQLNLTKLTTTYFDDSGDDVYLTRYSLSDDGHIKTKKKKISGDGSFDSKECLKALDKCDVVITNPPFSIFNRFFDILRSKNKDFIVIGPILKVQVKAFRDELLAGNVHSTGIKVNKFICEDDYENYHSIDDDGNKIKNIAATVYSTFDVNQKPDLATMYQKTLEHYDDYDAINVDSLRDIPFGYLGKIGVPITILHTNYEDYFEVVDFADPTINGRNVFKRVIIKRI